MTGVIELQVMAWIFSACHDYMGQVDKSLGVKKALKMLFLTRCIKTLFKIYKCTMNAFIYLEWLNYDQSYAQKYFSIFNDQVYILYWCEKIWYCYMFAKLLNILSAFQTLVRIWTFFWPKGPDFVFIFFKSLAFI